MSVIKVNIFLSVSYKVGLEIEMQRYCCKVMKASYQIPATISTHIKCHFYHNWQNRKYTGFQILSNQTSITTTTCCYNWWARMHSKERDSYALALCPLFTWQCLEKAFNCNAVFCQSSSIQNLGSEKEKWDFSCDNLFISKMFRGSE